jgi:hypothetical protein
MGSRWILGSSPWVVQVYFPGNIDLCSELLVAPRLGFCFWRGEGKDKKKKKKKKKKSKGESRKTMRNGWMD